MLFDFGLQVANNNQEDTFKANKMLQGVNVSTLIIKSVEQMLTPV